MKIWIRLGLSAAGIVLVTALAGATVGGPTLVEVLGYDRADRKIFVVRHDHSQEGRPPELLYFALAGKPPDRVVRVPALGSHRKDVARIERIRKRLRPIPHASILDLQWQVDTLKADTLPGEREDMRKRRFHLRVRMSRWDFAKTMEMTTYCDGGVRLAGLYQLWDEPSAKDASALAIMAFRGDPTETCYEVQMPVLLTSEPTHFEGVHER